MASVIGSKIKEARTAAGMTQAEVAKAAKGVSARVLSKAERGMEELTPEQLEAVAEAIGVPVLSLSEAAPESTANETVSSPDPAGCLTEEELELLTLFRAADPALQNAALSLFKKGQQVPLFMSMLPEIFKGDHPKELLLALKSMALGSKVEDLLNLGKGLLANKNINHMAAAIKAPFSKKSITGSADAPAGENSSKEISVPLLAFTYFYSASIYILLLSFYFWQWRTDIKPEK